MVDISEVRKKISLSQQYEGEMHRRMEEAESAYNLALGIDITIPADTPLHTPSTAPAIVDHFVDQVRTNSPSVSIGPLLRGEGGEARRNALEALGRHVMKKLEEYEDEPLWDYLTFHLALLGASCVRVLFDASSWPDSLEEQKRAWPFLVRAVHPLNVHIAPGHRWPYSWVVETQTRFVDDIGDEYPDWVPNKKNVRQGQTEILLYWDKKTHSMFAGGNEVYTKPNLLGIPPYIWVYSGMGHKSSDGDPSAQSAGILRHALSELKAEIRLRTAADALWQRTVWPTLVGVEDAETFMRKWSAGPGRYIQVADMSEMPKFMPQLELPPALYTLLPLVSRSIEKATYSTVLEGQRPEGVDYGVLYGMQVGQARLRVDAVKHAVERSAGRLVGMVARYVENVLMSSVEVGGMMVRPEDIGGHYDYKVLFQSVSPIDNDRRAQTGLGLYQSGAISLRTLLRDYLKVENPTEEQEQIAAEKLLVEMLRGPAMQQAVSQDVNVEKQAEEIRRMAEEQKKQQTIRPAPLGPRLSPVEPGAEGTSPSARLGVQS